MRIPLRQTDMHAYRHNLMSSAPAVYAGRAGPHGMAKFHEDPIAAYEVETAKCLCDVLKDGQAQCN